MFEHGALPPSMVPGVVYPALPSPGAAWAMALQFQLAQSEWWPRERLESVQLQQAGALLRHALEHCPWYQPVLRPLQARLRQPDWAMWRDLPLLTRDTLRTQMEALRSRAPPPEHGPVSIISTSGSTGSPVLVARTRLNQLLWNAASLRDHLWHRRDLSAKLVAIRYLRQATDRGDGLLALEREGWGVSTDELAQTGPSVGLDIRTDVARQWAFLREQRPGYLLTYPSNLRALLQEARARGERLPGLLEVRTVSEALTDDLRAEVTEVLGVRVADVYSTKESGYVALQHPTHDGYLVQGEFCIVEVLRADGSPCGPGETGKVVLTDLHSFALPLIRYDIGDFAEVAPPSPCGRGLPAIRRILGRVRNMLLHTDGRKTWPLFPDRRLREVAPLRQYQVVQRALDRIEARVVLEQPMTARQAADLRDVIAGVVGPGFSMEVVQVDSIARSQAGKYEDFRCDIAD